MGKPVVVTGAAAGMGAAAAQILRQRGHEVIGVDIDACDLVADLSNETGREVLRGGVERLAPDGISGIIACAGVQANLDPRLVVSVNYFGAVATCTRLKPLLDLKARPRVVLVASNAVLQQEDPAIYKACLASDEMTARAAAEDNPFAAYISSKKALAQWMRYEAVKPEWAGRNIALNAVCPGVTLTRMTTSLLETEKGRALLKKISPTPRPDYADPRELGEVMAFLATMEGSFLMGQVIYVDGGAEALTRPNLI